MCVAIYLALTMLALIYSDSVIESLALSAQSEGELVIVLALGWEIVPALWPLFALAMVLSSAVTLFIVRRLRARE
jgi:hypothetical protein